MSFVKCTGCLQRRHRVGGAFFSPFPCFPFLFHMHSVGSAWLSPPVGSGAQDRTCLSLMGHQQGWLSEETGQPAPGSSALPASPLVSGPHRAP